MINLDIKKMKEKEISTQPIIAGQIIISTDIYRKVYYDDSDFSRIEITNSCIFFTNYNSIMDAYDSILINKLYVDLSTTKIYGINVDHFINILNTTQVNTIISSLDSYKVCVIKSIDNRLAAIVSTQNQILTETGLTLDESLDPTKLLTVVRVKFVYVTVKIDNTRTIYIPFPKENFDFANGDMLCVVKNDFEYQSKRYIINGSYLVLKDEEVSFMKDEMLTLIFYYKTSYDLNSLVALGSQNIIDGSITTEKLSPYLEFSADYITETGEKIFFTPNEKEKLKNIEEYATHYTHPNTHPAEMITESDQRMFISKNTLLKILTTDNGYSKSQIDSMFTNLIGGAPELLNQLNELATAINGDANYGANTAKLINARVLQIDFDKLSSVVDTKVNNNDYVRCGIYGTPNKTNITGVGELYTLDVDDSTLLEYVDGMKVILKIKSGEGNISDPYLRINSLSQKSMVTPDGLSLLEGDLSPEGIYEFRYNGTKDSFMLQGKGGVNILGTTLSKYQISAGENITKGQLMDKLEDGTICSKRPHLKMMSLHETEQPIFYSNGQVEIVEIDKDSTLVLWKYDNSLRAKVVNLKNIYIDIDNTSYTELASNCSLFTLTKIGSNYIVSYSTTDNILNVKHLQINDSQINIISGSQYIKSETSSILQLYTIDIGSNKVILLWRVGTDTKCTYFNFSTNILSVMSNRTYPNYTFNKICKISNNQIMCSILSGRTIICFIIIVNDADMSFCDLQENFYTDATDLLSNLSMVAIDDTSVYMSWTNSQSSKYFYMNVKVNIQGGLISGLLLHKDITSSNIQSYLIYKQLKLEAGYFLSLSDYNSQIPTTVSGSGKDCIKLLISKNANPFDQVDIFSNTYNLGYNYSFTILNNKRVVIVFNSKQSIGDVSHLYFMVCDIIKNPFAIALQSGVGGDTIRVREW